MNPLSIDELQEDLNLRYERLSSKSESTKRDDFGEERALFITQYKRKCRNWGKLGHQSSQCRSKMVKDDKNEVICNYCKKAVITRITASNYRERTKKAVVTMLEQEMGL